MFGIGLIVKVIFSMSKMCSIIDNHEFSFSGFGCYRVLVTCFMAITHFPFLFYFIIYSSELLQNSIDI